MQASESLHVTDILERGLPCRYRLTHLLEDLVGAELRRTVAIVVAVQPVISCVALFDGPSSVGLRCADSPLQSLRILIVSAWTLAEDLIHMLQLCHADNHGLLDHLPIGVGCTGRLYHSTIVAVEVDRRNKRLVKYVKVTLKLSSPMVRVIVQDIDLIFVFIANMQHPIPRVTIRSEWMAARIDVRPTIQ